MEYLEEYLWCCPSCLLLKLLFPDGDIPDTSVDVVVEDHSGDLQLAFDELCVPYSKLRLVHHNVQGLGSKWDELSQWMVASADSASIF